MDPYKQYGYSEGCSSSESGWTTYIASPMEEDGSDQGDEHAAAAAAAAYANGGYCSGNYRDIIAGGVGEADSDDSMASDASSGPCYNQGENVRHQAATSLKHHDKGRKSISSSFSQFLSGIKSNSSKDKKSEADRKLPAGGSRKRWK
ncbi:Protein SOB FIVE-LIKE 4 [Linum grandiflorum]